MKTIDVLKDRRSYYAIGDQLPVSEEQVVDAIEQITELVPDAFNMKSQRVVVALGEKHKELWAAIYDVFEGKVAREKIDMFKAGAGSVLFFYDGATVAGMEQQYSAYAENFKPWALQANGMLQISVWNALRELGLGASLQHYNPVINAKVAEMFGVDEKYVLMAQMVFGNILAEPEAKPEEDISARVKVFR